MIAPNGIPRLPPLQADPKFRESWRNISRLLKAPPPVRQDLRTYNDYVNLASNSILIYTTISARILNPLLERLPELAHAERLPRLELPHLPPAVEMGGDVLFTLVLALSAIRAVSRDIERVPDSCRSSW